MSTYIMSDIHGCYEEMQEMLRRVNLKDNDLLVIAGDYIDRGKSNFAMLQWIETKSENVILLKGNHEEEFVYSIKVMDSMFVKEDLSIQSVIDTRTIYEYVKKMVANNGVVAFDYYGTIGRLIVENNVNMQQLLVWSKIIDEMPYVYESEIENRKCIVVHAGYIEKMEELETDEHYDSVEEFFLYARDDAYIYGGISHGMIIAGHTPTIFEEELPFNNGCVYRSYDEDLDCIFYNIDCGCVYKEIRKNAKLACIRLEDKTVFYV